MPAGPKPGAARVLMICGSLRRGSSNHAALATMAALAPSGVVCMHYEGTRELPYYSPDLDEPLCTDAAVVALRQTLADATAIMLCTPEYAGDLPGSFKNLLDWTVGGGEMDGRAVAWVNVAGPAAPTGAVDTHASLRRVLTWTGSRIVEAACARVPLTRAMIDADGLVADPAARALLRDAIAALVA